MIEVVGLSKRYGSAVAVDSLTFRVEPGRVTGFLGPNGAGKSTTMRLILGLDRPDSGTVLVGGRVGAVLETSGAHPGRTAFHHLLWLAQATGIDRGRIDAVLAQVGLSSVARRRVGGLSLGMTQRLGVAAALLGDPEILILDEPMNGLDPAGMVWLRALLRSLAASGRTVFISSHLMAEMAELADHLLVIDHGRLVASAPPAELAAGHPSLEAAFLALTDGTIR